MLVLARHVDEEIVIPLKDIAALADQLEGKEIRFKLIRTCGETSRIGIEAPRCLGVHRSEVYERFAETTPKELQPVA